MNAIDPKIPVTPELCKMIVGCMAVIQAQVDRCQASGAELAARPQLIDSRMVLDAIADHWKKSLPAVASRQVAPFVLDSVALRHLYQTSGASKAAESLRSFQPHNGDSARQITVLFAIFDRALKGKIYLLEDLNCEKETTL